MRLPQPSILLLGRIGQKFPLPPLWAKVGRIPEALPKFFPQPMILLENVTRPEVQGFRIMDLRLGELALQISILLTYPSSLWVFCVPDDPMKKKARRHPGFLPGLNPGRSASTLHAYPADPPKKIGCRQSQVKKPQGKQNPS